jgi:hypothetical protein
MKDPLALPEPGDVRAVWVFALDADSSALSAWRAPTDDGSWPLETALGVHGLKPDEIEVFQVADIATYGLVRYLSEANGMDPKAVEKDAATLGALEGAVVLVFSRALPAGPGALTPRPPLRFVGRYSAPVHLLPDEPAGEHKSAQGHVPPPATAPGPRFVPTRAAILTACVLLVIALIIWGLV